MTDAQRVALGDTIAGTNQYKVLAAVMSNITTAVSANETALSSDGSAMKENARYMESFEAKLSEIDSKWQSFSNNVVNNSVAKSIMDIVSAIMDLADTDLGQILTQITLLTSIGWGTTSLLKATNIVSAAKKQFETFATVIKLTKEGAGTFAESISAAGGAVSVALPAIAAITAAIVVLGKVVPAVVDAINDAQYAASYEGKVEAFDAAIENADKLNQKYEEANTRLNELNAVPWEDRTAEIQQEIDRLKTLVDIYKDLADSAEQEKVTAAREVSDKAYEEGLGSQYQGIKQLNKARNSVYERQLDEIDATEMLSKVYNDQESAVLGLYTDLIKLGLGERELLEAWAETADGSDEQEKAFNDLIRSLDDYGISVTNTKMSIEELGQAFNELRTGTKDSDTPGLSFDKSRFLELKTAYLDVYEAESLLISGESGIKALNEEQRKTRSEFEQMAAVDYMVSHSTEDLSQQIKGLSEEYGMNEDRAAFLIRANSALARSFTDVSEASTNYTVEKATIMLAKYIDMADKAINVKSKFDSLISSDGGGMDYSAGYEGYAEVYSKMQEYLAKNQIGGEFQAGASLLFDASTYNEFTDALENDLPRALEIAQAQMTKLSGLFGDADNAGIGFLSTIKSLSASNKELGATYSEVNGQTTIAITDLTQLSDALGVSESGVFAAIRAWKDYGIEASITSEELIGYLNDIGVSTENNIVNMSDIVTKMQELGASNEEIMSLQTLLSDMDNLTLQNPINSIDELKEGSDESEDSAGLLSDTLQQIKGVTFNELRTQCSLLATSIKSVETAANNAATAVNNIDSGSSGGTDKEATGTHNAPGGLTLVNENGPEIIEENGKQRIAGNGSPTLTNVKKGATIYNAEETSKMAMRKAGLSATVSTSSGYLNTLIGNYATSSTASAYSSSSTDDAWKNEFDEWLKWKDHQLAMDQITEQQYYDELNRMNEKYFANRTEYLDEYWKYQEKIYEWQKSKEKEMLNRQLDELKELEDAINEKYDAQIEVIEDTNDELETQLEYEELLANLAKAQSNRTLVYRDGRFQYVANEQDIAEAQAQLDAYNRQQEIEAQKEEIEKLRENELAAIIEQEEAINKKLDALSDNKGYASGSLGVHGGLSLVGESGPELRVLNRGDGIIPNNVTRNLMEWGAMNMSAFKSGIIDELRQFNGTVVQEFGAITLPNVTDVVSFINEMKQLKRYAYQR